MGQLTNLYVSQSYQGLLKMTDSTSGLTNTLQTVQTGDGDNSPLQMSLTQVNISGSLTVNGSPISVDTGSLVTTSSFNAYTSSVNTHLAGLDVETGSLQNQINGLATTGSLSGYTTTTVFNNYTGSNDARVNSLIAQTGSYVTETESGSFVTNVAGGPISFENLITVTKGNGSSSNITINNVNNAVSSSYATNALSASYAPDISNRNGLINTGSIGGSQSITGSLNVQGTLTATSASITYLETVYETASVIYSSGSNQFGDASNDTQTLFGTVNLPNGPLVITGSVTSTGGFNGNLTGTASYATNALSSSHAINADTASFVNSAVTASIAYDLVVRGKCDNPGGLTKGTIVRITGAVGDNPLFNSASWTDDSNSANTLGMLTENVAYNGFANIVTQGTVIGINTDNMTAGDLLFLSSSGQYTTSSVPAPYHEVRLGQVLRPQLNNGSAYISIDNGYELTELHDVDITNPVDGDLLVYRSGSYGQWVNETGGELGYATTGSNTFVGNQTILGALEINSPNPVGTFVNIISTGTTSFLLNSPLTQFQSNGEMLFKNTISSTGSADINFRTENGGDITFNTSNSGSVAITGSINISGSVRVIGNQINTGSLDVRSGSLDLFSNNTTVNTDLYLTNSLGGQSNIIKGWGDNPLTAGVGSNQANYTGSLRITGSNNTLSMPQIRATAFGSGGADMTGYISGSDNTIQGNFAGIYLNTGSLLFPKTTNNYLGYNSSLLMSFTTSSLAGGHPLIQNNTLYAGQININSNSGSLNINGNVLNGGVVTSLQNFVTNVRPAVSTNIINGSQVQLNHISSSIQYGTNISNANLVVNNAVSSSITNNLLAVNNNTFLGGIGGASTNHSIFVSGSQNSNAARTINNNLIGGSSNVISSSFVSSSNANLNSSIIYGNSLAVSASHTTGQFGGSAFFGRFNDTGSLADTQNIVFAVGTGAGGANRRTGLWIDQGSITNVSGSFNSIGNVNITGSLNVSGSNPTIKLNGPTSINGVTNVLTVTGSATIQHSIAGQNALTIINSVGLSQPGLEVQGQTRLLGNTLISGSAQPLQIVGQSMTNVGLQVTGTTTLIGNTTISGSDPLRVGVNNNKSVIQSLGGSQWLYRDSDNNTVVGNAFGVGNGFFAGSEKNMIFNGFATDFATGSNNVIIQGAGDNFISGSGNVFIGSHNGHAGGSNNILIGGTSYSSGSIFDSKFELGTLATSRIFHKQGTDPLQIGDDTQVTGSISISSVMNLKPQNPLPTGNIGDLAVSSSNQLYFYNGAWTLIV